MSPLVLLTYYCLLILLASIAGGMIPIWFRLTHRVMEVIVSFVAGVMLGVGLLHMLPHALEHMQEPGRFAKRPGKSSSGTDLEAMLWVLAGLLTMFFIERFLCFHHHGVEDGEVTCSHDQGDGHSHGHDITWSGAAIGLTLAQCHRRRRPGGERSTRPRQFSSRRLRHLFRDLSAQAIRLDDDRGTNGPRRLVDGLASRD